MADYVEILDTQIEPDAPLTAVLAGQWRDNVLAIAEGASGAPRVQRAAIQNSAINRVKIDTATNSVSGSLSIGGSVNITMDPYSFFPRTTASNANVLMAAGLGGSGSDQARFRLFNFDTDNTHTYSAAWRYIVS